MIKTLNVGEIVAICKWYKSFSHDVNKLKYVPLKLRWYLKKNMDVLNAVNENFTEMRDSQIEMIKQKYFSDEMSIEVKENTRQIKEEYTEQYQAELNELKLNLVDIMLETSTYEIQCYNIDAFVEQLPDDTEITFEDLEFLSFMAE